MVTRFHYQEYRSVAYDLVSSAIAPNSPASAYGTSLTSTTWTILGIYDKSKLSADDAVVISNPRNPSAPTSSIHWNTYAEDDALTYFAITYSGNEMIIRTEDRGVVEATPIVFPTRVDISVDNHTPYRRMLIYTANMTLAQIEKAWVLMHYEQGDDGYLPYEWPDATSQFANSVYQYLPEAFRTHDENDETTMARYPLLRYLTGALKYASDANDLADELESNLFDPETSRDEWLRWVSQIMGLGTSKALTPTQIRERIRAIAEIGSPAVGTRPHIASVVRQYLTGHRSVFIEPSKTNQWIINIILRTNEIPDADTGRIIRGVMDSGAVPAGHYVRVLLATTTWGAYDRDVAALGGTWDGHRSYVQTWADNDSLGTDFEETPDPEAPLPED